ncbi:MAG: glycosyltransferase family 39 protein [Candidatus Omnitrophica bacterium]|nr:glycosyltransferase family 39 protein [Candidatus Omnitrophota bacterium]MDE2223390.1 glycosyltransferase family 39 protein [Candidatus Omnitrophota bacterium]
MMLTKSSIRESAGFGEGPLSFRLLWGLFFIELAVVFLYALNNGPDRDEIEYLRAAWKILCGQRIYIDFFEHHHPLFCFLLVPLLSFFKANVMVMLAGRASIFLILLIMIILVYKTAKNLFGKESALISLILLLMTEIFIFPAVQVRADVPQALFELLSLFLLFSYFENKSLSQLVLSSIFLAVSFLFLQTAVFFIFAVGLLLVIGIYFREIKPQEVILYFSVLAVVLTPFYFYLVLNGLWHKYLIYNWTLNTNIFKFSILSDPVPLYLYRSTLKGNPLLWAFWVFSLFLLDTPAQKRAAIFSLVQLIILIGLKFYFFQYYLAVMPLIAMLAGYAIYRASVLFPSRKMLIVWFLVILYAVGPMGLYFKIYKSSPMSRALNKMRYVLSVTKPKDFVYDGMMSCNIFRKDMSFFWFSTYTGRWYYKVLKGHDYNPYALIDKFRPKVIVNDKYLNIKYPGIARHYRPSGPYPDLLIRTD